MPMTLHPCNSPTAHICAELSASARNTGCCEPASAQVRPGTESQEACPRGSGEGVQAEAIRLPLHGLPGAPATPQARSPSRSGPPLPAPTRGRKRAPGHERAQTGRTGTRTDGAQARDARAAGKSWGEARAAPARLGAPRTHSLGAGACAPGSESGARILQAAPGSGRAAAWPLPAPAEPSLARRGPSGGDAHGSAAAPASPGEVPRRGLARRQPPPPPPPAVKSAAGTKAGGEQSARSLAKLHLTRISPPSPARPAAPGACTQAAQPNPGGALRLWRGCSGSSSDLSKNAHPGAKTKPSGPGLGV